MIYIPIFVNIVLLMLFDYMCLSFSLCSPVFSNRAADEQDCDGNIDHSHIVDKKDAMPNGNHAESHRKAQDCTIGGEVDTDTGPEF